MSYLSLNNLLIITMDHTFRGLNHCAFADGESSDV